MTVLHNDAPPVRVVIEQRPPLVITPRVNTGGPATPGGGVTAYESPVYPAAMSWTINHNLGRKVTVSLYTTGSVEMDAQVVLITVNQAVALFSSPTTGFARVI